VNPALTARAPAKVNLGLRILGRRPDGYHELSSLFAPLDFGDELTLRLREEVAPRVTLRDGGGPFEAPTEGNLAVQAAEAFLAEARPGLSVEIELAKHVPLAAGLGGGSSDAGTVLRILARQAPGVISEARLAAIALSLGADVPFFLDPKPAWVGGIGEQIEPCKRIPPLSLLLVNPGVPLPTAEVFAAFDALGPQPVAPRPTDLERALADPEGLAALLHNDLEQAALRLRPELRRLREALASWGAQAVGMSGSGPTLFGVFESSGEAEEARARGPLGEGIWSRVARTPEAG